MAKLKCALGALLMLFSLNSNATLIDDEVDVSILINGGNFDGPDTVLVGAGVELVDYNNTFSVDIDAENIYLDCTGAFCGNNNPLAGQNDIVSWLFEDLDWVGMSGIITDVILTTDIASASVSFTDDSIQVDISGSEDPLLNSFIYLDIVTSHVPVPAPVTLMLLGFTMLLFRTKK